MPVYTSFVLRVWRVKEGQRWACRAMVERVSNGERMGFADLPSLIAFLQTEAETATAHQTNAEEPPKLGDRSK